MPKQTRPTTGDMRRAEAFLTDERLAIWNHVRTRAGQPPLSREEAVSALSWMTDEEQREVAAYVSE